MAKAAMSAKENKAVVCRYIDEAWNRHNIDATDELVSPEYINHAASAEYQRAGVKYSLNWLFSVFPDHRFDIGTPSPKGTRLRYGARAAAPTRASSSACRPRAGG